MKYDNLWTYQDSDTGISSTLIIDLLSSLFISSFCGYFTCSSVSSILYGGWGGSISECPPLSLSQKSKSLIEAYKGALLMIAGRVSAAKVDLRRAVKSAHDLDTREHSTSPRRQFSRSHDQGKWKIGTASIWVFERDWLRANSTKFFPSPIYDPSGVNTRPLDLIYCCQKDYSRMRNISAYCDVFQRKE